MQGENEFYGLINKKGEEVIEPKYRKVSFQKAKLGEDEVVIINKVNGTYQIIKGDEE